MTRRKGKILVIRGGAIGDFILTLPVFAALRRQFPGAELEALAYPHIAELASAAGLVDRVRPVEARALAGFFARGGTLDPRLADYFAGFSLILSYLYDPDEIFEINVRRCSDAQFLAGPHRPNESEEIHATQAFLKPLERLAVFDADSVPRLLLPTENGPLMGTGRWIALHPGSGSETKNWAEAKWQRLIARFVETTSWQILMVCGEAEQDRVDRLRALIPSERLRVASGLSLVGLARQLSKCSGYIGHDSGISHLASALGLPGLILWGPSRRQIWEPPGRQIHVLSHPHGLAGLDVDEVWNALPF